MRAVELVTLSAAAKRLDIPRTTLSNWANRDGILHARGLDRDGTALYDLSVIQALAVSRRRPRR